ncbi:MAG: hypothetical protein LH624_01130, partial [Cryobacterium sp.]|nr:hypothetical protein [Cryobacterium sp.]
MTHIDRENLALIAMAEFDLTDPERQHLSECPECSLELIALQHTAAVGRSARSVHLVEPGDGAWAGIHSALGLSDAVAATPRLNDYASAVEPDVVVEPAAVVEPAPTPAPNPTDTATATVTDIGSGLRPRSRRRNWMPVALAAGIAGLLGGRGGGIWWQSAQQPAPAPRLLAA